MNEKYEPLLLENQVCFPLYAAARELIKKYDGALSELDLTYTQYVVMIVLWEKGSLTVKELGEALYLDSGTLTPLLKRLEGKGLITRTRLASDERSLSIAPTHKGVALKDSALAVPNSLLGAIGLTEKETQTLRRLLYKILENAK